MISSAKDVPQSMRNEQRNSSFFIISCVFYFNNSFTVPVHRDVVTKATRKRVNSFFIILVIRLISDYKGTTKNAHLQVIFNKSLFLGEFLV